MPPKDRDMPECLKDVRWNENIHGRHKSPEAARGSGKAKSRWSEGMEGKAEAWRDSGGREIVPGVQPFAESRVLSSRFRWVLESSEMESLPREGKESLQKWMPKAAFFLASLFSSQ